MNCFSFSLCAFSNAVIFKDIDSNDVEGVENFVRFELETAFNVKVSAHFFGEFTTSDSRDFHFSPVEKKMIEFLVTHVKYVVDADGINSRLDHFTRDNASVSQIEEFQMVGKYFGDTMSTESDELVNAPTKSHFFLRKLLATADQNSTREKHGYRYDEQTKQFATYLRLLSGPFAYDTLQKNLECALPTLSSTNRYIRRTNDNIIEGVARCDELLLYLQERNLPLVVSLSEDGTRNDGRVEYDSSTNQMIGFVQPISQQTGMPIPFSYKARNAAEMFQHFASGTDQSHFVNVVMAQPVAKVAPFCLLVFGSNGKYTTEDVAKRWSFLEDQLRALSIGVLTISSDSDPKYNCAMRKNSRLGSSSDSNDRPELLKCLDIVDWFSCVNFKPPFYMQDTPHIGTKLRNFFLKTNKNPYKLPFGRKYFISMHHLECLLDNFSKADHLLCPSTLNPIERQNFSSVLRMCSVNVTNLLRKNVEGSEGTAKFLDIMRDVIECFMDVKLSPLERVKKIWNSIFILRIWRGYILSTKELTLKDNYMTLNCLTCIELNAHGLVMMLIYLKENNLSHLFKPHLFNSQQCESLFRLIRSFTSTYSTVRTAV